MKSETVAYKRAAMVSLAVLACLALTVCFASVSVADSDEAAVDTVDGAVTVADAGNDDEFKDTGVSYDHAQLIALVIIVVLFLAVAGVAHAYYYFGKE